MFGLELSQIVGLCMVAGGGCLFLPTIYAKLKGLFSRAPGEGACANPELTVAEWLGLLAQIQDHLEDLGHHAASAILDGVYPLMRRPSQEDDVHE